MGVIAAEKAAGDRRAAGAVAVTGADGFIGRALCRHLADTGRTVRAVVRQVPGHPSPRVHHVALGDLSQASEHALSEALQGAYAVVHLAGRAHVLRERAQDPEAAYRAANVTATARIARAAVQAGVGRLLFASTVKVNGEATLPGRAFRPDDAPAPRDAYARSKAEAERVLMVECGSSSTVPLVLRLPLTYGPGVKGNFAALLDGVAAERTMPFGAVDNRRSLLYVGNLVEAIAAALDCIDPVRGVHFVADAESVSTPGLVRAMAAALKEPSRVINVPVGLLRVGGFLTGRGAMIERLVGSLEVDTASFRAATAWVPRHSLADGLRATAAWWRTRHSI